MKSKTKAGKKKKKLFFFFFVFFFLFSPEPFVALRRAVAVCVVVVDVVIVVVVIATIASFFPVAPTPTCAHVEGQVLPQDASGAIYRGIAGSSLKVGIAKHTHDKRHTNQEPPERPPPPLLNLLARHCIKIEL